MIGSSCRAQSFGCSILHKFNPTTKNEPQSPPNMPKYLRCVHGMCLCVWVCVCEGGEVDAGLGCSRHVYKPQQPLAVWPNLGGQLDIIYIGIESGRQLLNDSMIVIVSLSMSESWQAACCLLCLQCSHVIPVAHDLSMRILHAAVTNSLSSSHLPVQCHQYLGLLLLQTDSQSFLLGLGWDGKGLMGYLHPLRSRQGTLYLHNGKSFQMPSCHSQASTTLSLDLCSLAAG